MATVGVSAKIELNGLQEVSKTLSQLREQMKSVAGETGSLKKDLDGVGGSIEGMQGKFRTGNNKISGFFKDTKKVINDVGGAVESLGKGIQKTGDFVSGMGKSLAPVSAAAGGILVGAAKGSMDFEDTMAKVSTIVEYDVSLDKGAMRDEIMAISSATGVDANTVGGMIYDAVSAGQGKENAGAFVMEALDLSRAGFAEQAESLDLLSTIMNAYKLEAGEVGKVSDMLVQTQNKGKVTVGELASSMAGVIPTANAFGVNLEQLSAGYAIMTANGIKAAESTTYMKSMLGELGKSGTKASKILQKSTGKSFKQLMDEGKSVGDVLGILNKQAKKEGVSMMDLFGSSEAGTAASVLLGSGKDAFNDMQKTMGSSSGTVTAALDEMDTNSYKFQTSINQLKNTLVDLGDVLMTELAPIIEDVTKHISEFAEWFKALDPEMKGSIIKTLALVTALAPFLIIVGKIISIIGTAVVFIGKFIGIIGAVIGVIGKALAIVAGVFGAISGWVILAVVAVAAGVYLIIKYWDEIIAFLGKSLKFLGSLFTGAFTWLTGFLKEHGKTIAILIGGPIAWAIALVVKHWDSIKQAFFDAYTSIKETVLGFFAWYKETTINNFNTAKNKAVEIWHGLLEGARNIFEKIKNAIVTPLNTARDLVKKAIEKIKNIMNFDFKLPKLKMPHFNMTGKFSLAPPSMPKIGVDWYATGGIATGPSVVGIGEAGDEAILPLSNKKRMKPFADTVAGMIAQYNDNDNTDDAGGRTVITGNNFVIREEADIKRVAQELHKLDAKHRRSRGKRG